MKYWICMTCLAALAAFDSVGAAKPSKQIQTGEQTKPLTYENIVSYFKAAKFKPTEVQQRCTVLFEGEWKNANVYNYCLIIVENSDEDIQVSFYLTDAHEMNWVTEFLDGSFFTPAETQGLFSVMNSHRSVRGRSVGRFRVNFDHFEPRHAQIVVFSFSRPR